MTTNDIAKPLPTLFIGHGSPMNAIEDNVWSRGFQHLGTLLTRPKVVLAVSAHWFTPGTFLTGSERPPTIHDFGGFPDELFRVEYPAPGDVALAKRVVDLFDGKAFLRDDWGIDHGTWSVMRHLIPDASVPVVQLSIDYRLEPVEHLRLADKLRGLREEGVLIVGSGNVVHNLRHAFMNMRTGSTETPEWASQFDADVASAVEALDGQFLSRIVGSDRGRISHPSLDHYLPLLYAVGASRPGESVVFPITGFDSGSISMRSALIG